MAEETPNLEKINSLKELDIFLAKQNNTKNYVYHSDVPEICKNLPCILGIDEAGRGPVLGPMVYGISYCPIEKSDILKDLGCADSKQLTEENREKIFDELTSGTKSKTNIGWAIDVISPCFISENMLKRSKYSLNEISMDSAIGLINLAIDIGVNIAEIYVDTVGPPEKYQEKLLKLFPDFQITVAKKADSTYPIVSCASICAKVSRDHALNVWKFEEGMDLQCDKIGSGYPSDPATKAFLKNIIDPVFGFPRIVRFSWATCVTALDRSKAFNITFDEEDDENSKIATGASAITSFFNKKTMKNGKICRTKHTFFKNRHLSNVIEF